MRCSYFKADALRVCSRLSLEIAGFPNLQQRAAAAATPHGPQCRRRSLRIEPLETRQLLDAAGGVSSISSLWFENVSDQAAIAHAGAADWTIQSEDGSAQSIAAAAAQPDVYDWIVQFDTSSFGEISSVAETCSLLVGGGVEFEIIRGLGMVGQVLVRSSNAPIEEVAAWLSENAAIASFEQDAISQMDVSTPTDPLYNRLWGMAMIDAPEAWSLSTGSSNVVVAVIDTGVDYNHVDLAANLWVNPGEIADNEIDNDRNGFVDDLFGYNFLGNNGNSMDDNGHGTHVAGTIAAAANNSLGVAGVNWSSSIMSLKFLDGNGVGYLSDAVRAINYVTLMRTQYDVNVRVINCSWGGGGYSPSMHHAIEAGNQAGILFIAAAGNSGSNNDAAPQYPANYTNSNVISVAAVAQNGQLASFSSYGATTVDLAAPGVSIYSTIPGNRYAAFSGTSMAAPHVAGVAALAFAYAPDASAAQVRDAILDGAEYSSALAGKTVTGGILNAYNTLELLAEQFQGPADDHGDNAASAAAVAVPSSTFATLGGAGDVDWFKFHATAGKTYTFSTQLQTLADSVLYLYAGNGSTVLAHNDDSLGGGLASRIQWTAPSSGTYYLAVAGYGGTFTGTYTLNVGADNSAPVLEAIADQAISHGRTTFEIPISASDADGDPLSYSAAAYSVDPLAREAYELDRQYDLYQWQGSFWTNLRGQKEKYIASRANGVNHPLLIFPNGNLYQWEGSMNNLRYISTLSVDYYNNPFLLCNAQTPRDSAVSAENVQLSVSGGLLTIQRAAGYMENFFVELSVSDGAETVSTSFRVSLTNSPPELSPISDRTMSQTQTTMSVPIVASDADGDPLCYSAEALGIDPMSQRAYDLDQHYNLYQWQGSFWTNLRGQNEKYIASRTNGVNHPFLIFPDGNLYQWEGSMNNLRYISTLSVDYYNNPFLLCNAQKPGMTSLSSASVSVGMQGNVLTLTRHGGYSGEFYVRASVTDGANTDSEMFRVTALGAASGAASPRATSLRASSPPLEFAAKNLTNAGSVAPIVSYVPAMPAELPDLRSIWSNYHANNRAELKCVATFSTDTLYPRVDGPAAIVREDVFSRLSPSFAEESEDALLHGIDESISSIRREVDELLFGRGDPGLDTTLEDDALGFDFRLGKSLERSAVDLIHETLCEHLDSPLVLL